MRHNLARERNKLDWNIDGLREDLLREIRILEQRVFTSTICLSDISPMMTTSLYSYNYIHWHQKWSLKTTKIIQEYDQ